MKISIAALVVTVLSLPAMLWAAPEVGKEAPEFTVKGADGEEYSLSDYRGKHVVLEWVNFDCPFVGKFYGSGTMQALQKEFTDEGVVWLSINSSSPGSQGHMTPETARTLAKEKNAAHTALLLDSEFEVAKAYEAKATPHMYVIDPEGILIYQGAIDSIPTADVADIEKAENYVRAAYEASKEGKPVEKSVTRSYGCGIKYP